MTASAVDTRIRKLRPPKARVDPYTAHGTSLDEERRPDGRIENTLTVFLAGAECPFTCSFCDLWRWTIDGATPPGALTRQLETVLQSLNGRPPDRLKLYNASNFFDKRAVPPEDITGIAALASPFAAVTVESHANTIGSSALTFAQQIPGLLEVAIGLETTHPAAVANLNKHLDLERFDRAADFLAGNDISLRVFVLLGAPYVPPEESIAWTTRAVEHATRCGASVVSIIPVRGGNGELERLQALGHFTPPALLQLEETLESCLPFTNCVVTVDLWDVERLIRCEHCRAGRVARLARMNLSGRREPRITCAMCGAA